MSKVDLGYTELTLSKKEGITNPMPNPEENINFGGPSEELLKIVYETHPDLTSRQVHEMKPDEFAKMFPDLCSQDQAVLVQKLIKKEDGCPTRADYNDKFWQQHKEGLEKIRKVLWGDDYKRRF